LPRDGAGLWVSNPMEGQGSAPGELVKYRSANRGIAGPVYALSRIRRAGFEVAGLSEAVEQAVDWLLAHEGTVDDQLPGLHFGEAGVALAVSEAIRSGILPEGAWTLPYFTDAFSQTPDWPDFT